MPMVGGAWSHLHAQPHQNPGPVMSAQHLRVPITQATAFAKIHAQGGFKKIVVIRNTPWWRFLNAMYLRTGIPHPS